MLTVILDHRLTRRKTAHLVVNQDGEPLFSASRIGDVFDWMRERDLDTISVETIDGHTYLIGLRPAPSSLKGFLPDPDDPAT